MQPSFFRERYFHTRWFNEIGMKNPSVNGLDVPGYLWEICHLHNDQWQICWYRPGFDRSDGVVFISIPTLFCIMLCIIRTYIYIIIYIYICILYLSRRIWIQFLSYLLQYLCVFASSLYIFEFIFISMHFYSCIYLPIHPSSCLSISSHLSPSTSIPSILQYERPSIAVSHQSDYDYPLTPTHRIHRPMLDVQTLAPPTHLPTQQSTQWTNQSIK